MRFIILHKTNAHWEAGAIPGSDLIARVGTLMGELAKSKMLLGAAGLRATSQGVRVTFSGASGSLNVGGNELAGRRGKETHRLLLIGHRGPLDNGVNRHGTETSNLSAKIYT